jgi:transposase
MAKRYGLSDEACAVVADLFAETHGRGRSRLNNCLMLDGVLWVLRSGAPLRGEICRNALARGQRCTKGFVAGETRGHSIKCLNASPCWTRSSLHRTNVNAVNGCLPTRAMTLKRYAATPLLRSMSNAIRHTAALDEAQSQAWLTKTV